MALLNLPAQLQNNGDDKKRPWLFMVDLSSVIHRAFHALPPLTNRAGEPVQAILGFFNMMRAFFSRHQPTHALFVLDAPDGKLRRQSIHSDYKGQRAKMPSELLSQLHLLKQLLCEMEMPSLELPGEEADDLLATLAHQVAVKGWEGWVMSPDKDLAQVVAHKHLYIWDDAKQRKLGRLEIFEKYGVYPEQLRDYLALMGDASDQVPGVAGIGAKGAAQLLAHFGNLDVLLQVARERDPQSLPAPLKRWMAALRSGEEAALLSRSLVTLRHDLPLPCTLEALIWPKPISEACLLSWLDRLGFARMKAIVLKEGGLWGRPLLKKSTGALPLQSPSLPFSNHPCWLPWPDFFAKFFSTPTPLNIFWTPLAGGLLLEVKGYMSWVAMEAHPLEGPLFAAGGAHAEDPTLAQWFARPQDCYCGVRSKVFLKQLKRQGYAWPHKIWDGLLVRYTLHGMLDDGQKPLIIEGVLGEAPLPLPPSDVSELVEPWSLALRQLREWRDAYEAWPSEWAAAPWAQKWLEEVEFPLVFMLAQMESQGILVEAAPLQQLQRDCQTRIEALERQIFDAAGRTFNLHSPLQLQEILFDTLALPVVEKTSKGQPSTRESALHQLAALHPLPQWLCYHRTCQKHRVMAENILDRLDASSRIHTQLQQTTTLTGRLSSTQPNLQNVPIKSEMGAIFRESFVAPKGHQLIALDYAQIELRLLAHLSEDETLIAAFQRDEDIHEQVAMEIFNKPASAIEASDRRAAKSINFGILYGMSAFGLAKQLNLSRAQATLLIQRFFERYPKAAQFVAARQNEMREVGAVTTLSGRAWRLEQWQKGGDRRPGGALRAAVNAPIQGSAAELIKAAMVDLYTWIQEEKLQQIIVPLLQIHDELLFEVKTESVAEMLPILQTRMTSVWRLKVPLKVTAGAGRSWRSASLKVLSGSNKERER